MPIRTETVPGEFCWVDLAAHNLESAAAWYGELFGWSHHTVEGQAGAPPYAFFMKGEAAVGGIGQMSEEMKAQGIPPMWNNYVSSADCAATEAKVKDIGGTVTVSTMEVPDHGKLAFFLDPEGASFAAWQGLGDAGPGILHDEPGGVCWTELMTRDSKQASEFYGKLFGWEFEEALMGEEKYTMIKNGEKCAGGMMGMSGPGFEKTPAHWHLYFAIADCQATVDQIQATGGKVIVPPTEIQAGTFSMTIDPQGAVFGIIQLASSSA